MNYRIFICFGNKAHNLSNIRNTLNIREMRKQTFLFIGVTM